MTTAELVNCSTRTNTERGKAFCTSSIPHLQGTTLVQEKDALKLHGCAQPGDCSQHLLGSSQVLRNMLSTGCPHIQPVWQKQQTPWTFPGITAGEAAGWHGPSTIFRHPVSCWTRLGGHRGTVPPGQRNLQLPWNSSLTKIRNKNAFRCKNCKTTEILSPVTLGRPPF